MTPKNNEIENYTINNNSMPKLSLRISKHIGEMRVYNLEIGVEADTIKEAQKGFLFIMSQQEAITKQEHEKEHKQTTNKGVSKI